MHGNILELIVEIGAPYIISALEIVGIIVIVWTAVSSFVEYIKDIIQHKKFHFMHALSQGLAAGLSFLMAGEILKTVIIKEMNQLLVLGVVIVLRTVLSLIIHFEMKHTKED